MSFKLFIKPFIAVVVDGSGFAISFFVDALSFKLAEDFSSPDQRPATQAVEDDGESHGMPSRACYWPRPTGTMRPPSSGAANGQPPRFLPPDVEDSGEARARIAAADVEFLTEPRTEAYGQVAVFRDIAGNKWDLIAPAR